jgi:lipoprotein-anchoring transpeptidase ErfK/SrfK
MGVMIRIVTAASLAAFAGMLLQPGAQAQTAPSGVRTAQASQPTETSAQRRRAVRRVPIYPRDEWRPDVYPQYYPGANAVRECTATYVQEYRPSGTVITPRMNCYWRGG